MSDLVLAHNCCMARMLPGEAELVCHCRNEQVCQGGQKVYSALSGPMDWKLRYIKTNFLCVCLCICTVYVFVYVFVYVYVQYMYMYSICMYMYRRRRTFYLKSNKIVRL